MKPIGCAFALSRWRISTASHQSMAIRKSWRFVGKGLPLSREAAQEKLAAMIYRWESLRIPIWAVERKDNGEWIGRCGFSPYLDGDEIEITYTFRRPNWGRGFASEAASACLDYARKFSAWPHIMARSHPDNVASKRVIEKLGFEYDRFDPEHADGPLELYILRCESPCRHRSKPGVLNPGGQVT